MSGGSSRRVRGIMTLSKTDRSVRNVVIRAAEAASVRPYRIEGVLALIKNRDVMAMTVASFFSSLAFLVVRYGIWFDGGNNRDGAPVWVAILASFQSITSTPFQLSRTAVEIA